MDTGLGCSSQESIGHCIDPLSPVKSLSIDFQYLIYLFVIVLVLIYLLENFAQFLIPFSNETPRGVHLILNLYKTKVESVDPMVLSSSDESSRNKNF